MEQNVQKYELSQDNKQYIFSTSQLDNKLIISCSDNSIPNKQIFTGEFTIEELCYISKYFTNFQSIDQIQNELNKAVETQNIGILDNPNDFQILFYLKNNDIEDEVSIPLKNKNIISKKFMYQSNSPNRQIQNSIISNQINTTPIKNQNINNSSSKKYDDVIKYTTKTETQNFNNTYQNNSLQFYDTNSVNYINSPLRLSQKFNNSIQLEPINEQISYSEPLVNNSVVNDGNSIFLPDPIFSINKQNVNENLYSNSVVIPQGQNDYLTNVVTTTQTKINDPIYLTTDPTTQNNQYIISSPKLEKYQTQTEYTSNNSQYIPSTTVFYSPPRQQIQYIPSDNFNNESIIKQTQISKNLMEQYFPATEYNIIENPYCQNCILYSLKISNLENDLIKTKNQHIELKNEINRLIEEIKRQRNNIEILTNENKTLKENCGKFINNNIEINLLKQENERIIKEYENLKQINQKEFENYKKIKEKEIEQLRNEINNLIRFSTKTIIEKKKTEPKYITINETYKEVVKGNIIHNTAELELLTRKINNENQKIILNLLYKASVDSDKASAFHEKCDNVNSSLVLIETKNGKRFGGFTKCSWSGNSINKKDESAFIFSLDKMKIYEIIPGEDAIGCYPKYGPVFLGCQIRIYDDFFTKGGTTFEHGLNYNTEKDYELTDGENKFDVKEVEVYGVYVE